MAGGVHVGGSAEFLQASYPQNWEYPEHWSSENDFERAGWCATVHNTDSGGPHGWDLYVSCRDTSSIDVGSLEMLRKDVLVEWSGQGDMTSTSRCPEGFPIPWGGGFAEKDLGPTSKIWALATIPVDWEPESWPVAAAGWQVHVRGYNGPAGNGSHSLETSIICGKTGQFDLSDRVEMYSTKAYMVQGGKWAATLCSPEYPIPLTGGARSSSTATVLTVSYPDGWDTIESWTSGGAMWWAGVDNWDQNQQSIESLAVCRALRDGETLP